MEDLSVLLKSQEVKVNARLNKSREAIAQLKRDITDIEKLLENKAVKLNVSLYSTVGKINEAISAIQTQINTAKTIKKVKLPVELATNNLIGDLQKDLKEAHRAFIELAKDVKLVTLEMDKLAKAKAKAADTKVDPLTGGAGKKITPKQAAEKALGFDPDAMIKSVHEAEKKLAATFGKGMITTTINKDAKGAIQGFTSQIDTLNGFVEKVKYQWNQDAKKFSPISEQTVKSIDKHKQQILNSINQVKNVTENLGDSKKKSAIVTQLEEIEAKAKRSARQVSATQVQLLNELAQQEKKRQALEAKTKKESDDAHKKKMAQMEQVSAMANKLNRDLMKLGQSEKVGDFQSKLTSTLKNEQGVSGEQQIKQLKALKNMVEDEKTLLSVIKTKNAEVKKTSDAAIAAEKSFREMKRSIKALQDGEVKLGLEKQLEQMKKSYAQNAGNVSKNQKVLLEQSIRDEKQLQDLKAKADRAEDAKHKKKIQQLEQISKISNQLQRDLLKMSNTENKTALEKQLKDLMANKSNLKDSARLDEIKNLKELIANEKTLASITSKRNKEQKAHARAVKENLEVINRSLMTMESGSSKKGLTELLTRATKQASTDIGSVEIDDLKRIKSLIADEKTRLSVLKRQNSEAEKLATTAANTEKAFRSMQRQINSMSDGEAKANLQKQLDSMRAAHEKNAKTISKTQRDLLEQSIKDEKQLQQLKAQTSKLEDAKHRKKIQQLEQVSTISNKLQRDLMKMENTDVKKMLESQLSATVRNDKGLSSEAQLKEIKNLKEMIEHEKTLTSVTSKRQKEQKAHAQAVEDAIQKMNRSLAKMGEGVEVKGIKSMVAQIEKNAKINPTTVKTEDLKRLQHFIENEKTRLSVMKQQTSETEKAANKALTAEKAFSSMQRQINALKDGDTKNSLQKQLDSMRNSYSENAKNVSKAQRDLFDQSIKDEKQLQQLKAQTDRIEDAKHKKKIQQLEQISKISNQLQRDLLKMSNTDAKKGFEVQLASLMRNDAGLNSKTQLAEIKNLKDMIAYEKTLSDVTKKRQRESKAHTDSVNNSIQQMNRSLSKMGNGVEVKGIQAMVTKLKEAAAIDPLNVKMDDVKLIKQLIANEKTRLEVLKQKTNETNKLATAATNAEKSFRSMQRQINTMADGNSKNALQKQLDDMKASYAKNNASVTSQQRAIFDQSIKDEKQLQDLKAKADKAEDVRHNKKIQRLEQISRISNQLQRDLLKMESTDSKKGLEAQLAALMRNDSNLNSKERLAQIKNLKDAIAYEKTLTEVTSKRTRQQVDQARLVNNAFASMNRTLLGMKDGAAKTDLQRQLSALEAQAKKDMSSVTKSHTDALKNMIQNEKALEAAVQKQSKEETARNAKRVKELKSISDMSRQLQRDMLSLANGAAKAQLEAKLASVMSSTSTRSTRINNLSNLQQDLKDQKALEAAINRQENATKKANREAEQSKKRQLTLEEQRAKLINDIAKLQREDLRLDAANAKIGDYQKLLRDVRAGNGEIKEQMNLYNRLNRDLKTRQDAQREELNIAKTRTRIEREFAELKTKFSSNDRAAQNLIREIQAMKERAKTAREYYDVEKRLEQLKAQNNDGRRLRENQTLQTKVNDKIRQYAALVDMSEKQMKSLEHAVKRTAQRGTEDLNRMFTAWERKVKELQQRNREAANQTQTILSSAGQTSKGVTYDQYSAAVKNRDVQALKEYTNLMTGLKAETVRVDKGQDSLGRAVERVTVKMKGKGKTVQTVTYELDRLSGKLREVQRGVEYNANRNLGVFEQLKVAMMRVPVWFAGTTVFYGSINMFRRMGEEILKVDKSLTELRRVADSGINIDHIFERTVTLSRELGNNVNDVMQTMNDFARTFGQFNERQLLAITNTATLMSNVSELKADEAGNSLIGVMNAFNIEAEESIRIVDAFNEVDNNFAVSTKQLAEGMAKTSATAATFGVSMEESIGHITTIASVTMESGRIIGNGLKTVYSRITTMADAASILQSVGVSVRDLEGNIRPVNDILTDLGGKWKSLTDEQRQNIGVTVAGRYQLSRFLALMNGWDMALEATETALLSQGSAMRENDKYLNSMEAKINSLKTAFTEMALAVGDSFLEDFILIGVSSLEALAGAIETISGSGVGALGMLTAAVGIAISAFGGFKTVNGHIASFAGGLRNATSHIRNFGTQSRTALGLWRGEMQRIGATNMTPLQSSLARINASMNILSASFPRAAAGLHALNAAVRGFGMAIASALGWAAVFAVIGIAISKLAEKWREHNEEVKRVQDVMDTMVNSYRTATDIDGTGNINDLIERYEHLHKKSLKSGTAEYNEYLEVNQRLAELLPNMVSYVDSTGKAHLKNVEAIKEEAARAQELSLLYAQRDMLSFDLDIKADVAGMEEIARDYIIATGMMETASKNIKEFSDRDTDNLIKNMTKQATAQQQLFEQVQTTNLTIKDGAIATLEASQVYSKLSEIQVATVEGFITNNENKLMAILKQYQDGTKTWEQVEKEMQEHAFEVKETAVRLGHMFNDVVVDAQEALISNLDSNASDYETKVENVVNQTSDLMDGIINNMPKSFFSQEALESPNIMRKKLQEVMDVVIAIGNKDGRGMDELVKSLENTGLSADEAAGFITQWGLTLDNAAIQNEAFAKKQEGIIDSYGEVTEQVKEAIEAIDAYEAIFDHSKADISAVRSHIEALQALDYQYNGLARNTEQYKESLKTTAAYFGVSTDHVKKNLAYYRDLTMVIENVSFAYGDNSEIVGVNTDNLTKHQLELYKEYTALTKKGQAVDIATLKGKELAGATELQAVASAKATEETSKYIDKIQAEGEAIAQAKAKFEEFKTSGTEVAKLEYLTTVNNQLDEFSGRLKYSKDEVGNFRLEMANGTHSTYLENLNAQFEEAGLKITNVIENEDGLRLKLQTPVGDNLTLDVVSRKADEASEKIERASVIMETFNKKDITMPTQSLSGVKLDGLMEQIGKTHTELSTLKSSLEEVVGGTTIAISEIDEVLNKSNLVIATSKDVLGSIPSFEPLKNQIKDIIMYLEGIRAVASNAVNMAGVEAASYLQPLEELRLKTFEIYTALSGLGSSTIPPTLASSITQIGISLTDSSAKALLLRDAMNLFTQVGVGSLPALELALGNVTARVSAIGNESVTSKTKLEGFQTTIANIVSVMNTFAQTVVASSSLSSLSYADLAQKIAMFTAQMIVAYQNNARELQLMSSHTNTELGRIGDYIKASTVNNGMLMAIMAENMSNIFKQGIDNMVSYAEGMPKRIADAIIKNQAVAISAIKGMINSIGSTTEAGLNDTIIKGVNSVLTFMGVDKAKIIPKISIPKYAKGTDKDGHPGGYAVVGEEGRELAYIPQSQSYTMLGTKGSELVNLPKGASVLPNKKTEELLKSHGFPAYATGVGDWFNQFFDDPGKLLENVWGSKEAGNISKSGAAYDISNQAMKTVRDEATRYLSENMFTTYSFDSLEGIFGAGFRKTSNFGPRWGRMHEGYDFAAPSGTPYKSPVSAQVYFSGYHDTLGNVVMARDGAGYTHWFGHNSKNLVKTGDIISKGQTIALVGSTGRSTGPHIHYEIRKNGVPVDYGKQLVGTVSALNDGAAAASMNVSGSGVQRWSSVAAQALRIAGQYSEANLQRLLYQMKTESSGNPKSINNWDSNAKRGTPSKGLMQVIDPTFKAYAHPSYNKNIYDPLSNILASIRYSLSRYGSLTKAWRGVGYEEGGIISHEHLAMVGEGGKREAIIPLEQHKTRATNLWYQAGQELGLIQDGQNIELASMIRANGEFSTLAAQIGESQKPGEKYQYNVSYLKGVSAETQILAMGRKELEKINKLTAEYNKQVEEARKNDENYVEEVRELAELWKEDMWGTDLSETEHALSMMSVRLSDMTELSWEYRAYSMDILDAELKKQQIMALQYKDLNTRNAVIKSQLKMLADTSRHTVEQREHYNAISQELVENKEALRSFELQFEEMAKASRDTLKALFQNLIDHIRTSYEETYNAMEAEIDDIDFELEVLTYIDPDNLEKEMALRAKRLEQLKEELWLHKQNEKNLRSRLAYENRQKVRDEDKIKILTDELNAVEEQWEDTYIKILEMEQSALKEREDYADELVEKMKEVYESQKEFSIEAKELEIENAEKAHEAKMKLYDEEIEKIQELYDAKLKAIDDKVDEDSFNKEVAALNKERTEIQTKIALLSRNDTRESKKQVQELQEELLDVQEKTTELLENRRIEKLKESIELQRDSEIERIETIKEEEEIKHETLIEKLEVERDEIEKHYDSILNNEKYWADMGAELVKGHFFVLNDEFTKLGFTMEQAANGVFDTLNENFLSYRADIQNFVQEMNSMISSIDTSSSAIGSMTVDPNTVTNAPTSIGKPSIQVQQVPKIIEKAYKGEALMQPDENKDALYTAIQTSGIPQSTMKNIWLKAQNNQAMDNPTPEKIELYKMFQAVLAGHNISRFNTGGYTGDWLGQAPKLALLDKKEAVLKATDTENLLEAIKIVRALDVAQPNLKVTNVNAQTQDISSSSSEINIHIDKVVADSKKSAERSIERIGQELKRQGFSKRTK